MTRVTPRKPTRALAGISLALLATSTSACVSNRITVATSDGDAVAQASALHTQAENALRAKGYSVAASADSDLILEITHRTAPVTRRSRRPDGP